jgi:hypothetical protein
LIGKNLGDKVVDSYALGDVTGETAAGGLIGTNIEGFVVLNAERSGEDVTTASSDAEGGGIHRSYAAGAVTATDNDGAEGGLVGSNNSSIEQSYWDTETTGQPEAVDSPGNLPSSVKALTTSEMQGVTPTNQGKGTMEAFNFERDGESKTAWFAVVEGEEINPTPADDGYPILEGPDPSDQLSAQGIDEAESPGLGDFEVIAITEATPTEVSLDESFTVQYTVENVGDETASQEVSLELAGESVATKPDTLTSGQSLTSSFSDVTLPGSVSAGDTVELTVRTNNDAETVELTVVGTATPSVADYTNAGGIVETPGLLDAIDDWRDTDEVGTDLLLEVIGAWRSQEPVE